MHAQRLGRLTPYVPGEQPQDRQYLKLNTNESPYPPSPQVARLLRDTDAERLRLYPDPQMTRLREAIARHHNLDPSWVFAGNGSDEVLSFCFYAFFDDDRGDLRFPEHTYSFYPVYCDFYGIAYRRVPLTADFEVDLDRLGDPDEPCCGVIFANPNAPTGHLLEPERIDAFLDRFAADRVVVVDEAYIDFGGRSAIPLLARHPNLLICRTFSKSLALAGMRLGYALGAPERIDALLRVKDGFNSYPLDSLAQQVGAAAIADSDYYGRMCRRIAATREAFSGRMTDLGWRVLPSAANFVFAARPGVGGADVYQALKAEGILVRHFAHAGIEAFVRITIGTEAQMDRLVETVGRLWPG